MGNETSPKEPANTGSGAKNESPKKNENWFQIGTRWLAALGGLGILYGIAEYHISTKFRLGTLEEKATTTLNAISKETDVRKMYWTNIFVYKKDSTNSHIRDSTLEYDPDKDFLHYVPKPK